MNEKIIYILLLGFCLNCNGLSSQQLENVWQTLPEESRPWVFWYWMQGAVTKEGITADIEAMKGFGQLPLALLSLA